MIRDFFKRVKDDERGEVGLPLAILGGVVTPLMILVGVPAEIQPFFDTTAGHLAVWAAGLGGARIIWTGFVNPARKSFQVIFGLDERSARLEVNQNRMHKRIGRIEEDRGLGSDPNLEPLGEHDEVPESERVA